MQHYLTIPNHVLIKFAQWEKILTLPQPTADLVYPTVVWHYARGMAYANTGKLDQAKEELKALKDVSQDSSLTEMMIWGINKVTEVCNLSSKVLEAEINVKEKKYKQAVTLLNEAVKIEDGLNYNEPPDWFFSVRHILGNVLLESKQYAEAEKVYKEDLGYWAKNGFALNGLYESLTAQQKSAEAEEVKKQLAEAWKYSEIELKGSGVDPEKRTNIAIRIDENSPNTLVYLASAVCN